MFISLIMPVCQVKSKFMSSQSIENSFGEELTIHPLFSQMINNSHGISPVALCFHSLDQWSANCGSRTTALGRNT